jgi:CheY-like chemotaxis protein
MIGTLTGSRIAVSLRLPETPCFVLVDPSQFDTALVNMAVNARDAMDGQGQITVVIQFADSIPAVRSHAPQRGRFAVISITDTGSGIPPENLERIFEPFFTTKMVGQGTGLGLSQVFGFAKQSGGDVTVESMVGEGTTFTLYLPQVDAPEERFAEPERQDVVDGHDTCVLVVEDNADVGTFATQTLAELGYGTHWAANAEEALAELAKHPGRFDVVFSDVVMPGMDGVELARRIRREHAGLPVVLTSGYSHVLALEGTGGFELLRKPYSVEELSRVLSLAKGGRARPVPSAS